jgi:hypothetical protein
MGKRKISDNELGGLEAGENSCLRSALAAPKSLQLRLPT